MNVFHHIETALIRGKSNFTMDDIRQAMREHRIDIWVGDRMSGSAWLRDGRGEIVHVGGHWNDADADWLLGRFRAYCAERGVEPMWSGRKGWTRFLKTKGISI